MRSIGSPLDAERLGAARAVQPDDVERAHDEDRRDERRDDTSDERDGKALHGTRSVLVENGGGEDRRYVRVDDRGHRMAEALVDRGTNRLTALELLTNALEDQHVCIDGNTDGKHE